MKNFKKTPQLIRIYGISACIIWYLFGYSYMLDTSDSWNSYVIAKNLMPIVIEYFMVGILVSVIGSLIFDYIIKKDIS